MAKGKQPGKYCGDAKVMMEDANLYERYIYTGQNCLIYNSR